jgi:hypothetical protein
MKKNLEIIEYHLKYNLPIEKRVRMSFSKILSFSF